MAIFYLRISSKKAYQNDSEGGSVENRRIPCGRGHGIRRGALLFFRLADQETEMGRRTPLLHRVPHPGSHHRRRSLSPGASFFSYYFLGTFRFWKYGRMGPRLIVYAYVMAMNYLKGEFSPSISLTAPPMTGPDPSLVQIHPGWENGESCADCGNCCKCCTELRCPLQEKDSGQCLGYGSFYWRYFNCGRYPASRERHRSGTNARSG